jgi:hypothetical protein
MDAEDGRWTEWDTGPVSRPYTLTGGRTRPRADRFYGLLDIVGRGRVIPDGATLGPEQILILDLCHVPVTVADLASEVGLPLGVVRILLDDLVQESLIEVRATELTTRITDKQLLRQIRDGLLSLLLALRAYRPSAYQPTATSTCCGLVTEMFEAAVRLRIDLNLIS